MQKKRPILGPLLHCYYTNPITQLGLLRVQHP